MSRRPPAGWWMRPGRPAGRGARWGPPGWARWKRRRRARRGRRVVAVGTTVVRALETAAAARERGAGSPLPASSGWTHHLVTPQTPPRVVDALFTGLHEPRSTHLLMLNAFAGADLLRRCYAA